MKKKGVTLLLAIIISSLAITLGVGISVIIIGELGISGAVKESYQAFYAADTGVECALYWDFQDPTWFSTSSPPVGVECGGANNAVFFDGFSTFDFQINNTLADLCSRVKMIKDDTGVIVTSLGENKECGAASSARTVQRGLQVNY